MLSFWMKYTFTFGAVSEITARARKKKITRERNENNNEEDPTCSNGRARALASSRSQWWQHLSIETKRRRRRSTRKKKKKPLLHRIGHEKFYFVLFCVWCVSLHFISAAARREHSSCFHHLWISLRNLFLGIHCRFSIHFQDIYISTTNELLLLLLLFCECFFSRFVCLHEGQFE